MSFVIHLWCDLHVPGWTVYFLCQLPISLILWPWATEVKNLDLNLFSSNLGNIRNRMWCFNEVTEFLRGRGVPAPGRCCLRQFRAALTPVLEMVLLRLFELLFKRFGAVSTKTCYRNKKSGPSVWAYSVIHFNISTSHFKTCSFHYFSIKMLFGFILLPIPEIKPKSSSMRKDVDFCLRDFCEWPCFAHPFLPFGFNSTTIPTGPAKFTYRLPLCTRLVFLCSRPTCSLWSLSPLTLS